MSNAREVQIIGSLMQASQDPQIREWGQRLRGMFGEIRKDEKAANTMRALMKDNNMHGCESEKLAEVFYALEELREERVRNYRMKKRIAKLEAERPILFRDELAIPPKPLPMGVVNLGMVRAMKERRT